MTLGLDTSVVVRLLIGVPEVLFQVARERLAQAADAREAVIVTDLVVAEAYHALRHHYAVPEAKVREQLRAFLDSGLVTPDSQVNDALRERQPPGLLDRLIHARHQGRGAMTLTFDRVQGRLAGAERLRSTSRRSR